METIFSKIIAREIPADIVYEDDLVLAFLDNQPIHQGHTLIVPKTPFVNIYDGDSETLAHMMRIAQQIGKILTTTVAADGINISMNNGAAAGQEVFHAHLHVIPRYQGDNRLQPPERSEYNAPVAKEIAETIRQQTN